MDHVVTVFVRNRGAVLLVRRSDGAGTYQGRWAGISGYVEGDTGTTRPDAERELTEEVGIRDYDIVRTGSPIHVVDTDHDREWQVHPYLVEVDTREIDPNWEIAEYEWTSPTAILTRETVPELWRTYRRVAPTVGEVAADDTHGSAHISVRALDVLRDAAAEAAHPDAIDDPEYADAAAVRQVARELRDARPTMVAVATRVNRVMSTADGPETITTRAQEVLQHALDADEGAAERAAELLRERTEDPAVVTLSQSGTVLTTLRAVEPTVTIAESRPAREGVDVAEALADVGVDVTVTTDANLAQIVAGDARDAPDAALVGADTVLSDGDIVNKVGTRVLALACAREDVPLYVVAARDKIALDDTTSTETGDPEAIYEGGADIAVENPIFDRTPADCVTGLVTEAGRLDIDDVRETAAKHREYAEWDER